MATFEYSKYFSELKDEEKKRYDDIKMKIVGCAKDPYCYFGSKESIAGVIEWTD